MEVSFGTSAELVHHALLLQDIQDAAGHRRVARINEALRHQGRRNVAQIASGWQQERLGQAERKQR